MFSKAFGWLSSAKNERISASPSRPTESLTDKFVKAVTGILRWNPQSSAVCREPSAKEVSDAAFFARLAELRVSTEDGKYSEGSRNRLRTWLDSAETYHASGGFLYASDWWAPMEIAASGLVDLSELRAKYRERLAEAELADITDAPTKISYYRTLDLAKAALEDPNVAQGHAKTLSEMLSREGGRIRKDFRVARTLSLRASFSDFRREIETMDFREYSVGSLRAMSVDFQAVIEASKHESWPETYDAAVSKLFKSFSELVHLGPLKTSIGGLETLLSKHRSFAKRWDASNGTETLALAKRALADAFLSKKDAAAFAIRTNSAFVALKSSISAARELEGILSDAASRRPDGYSRWSYAAIGPFVSKAASCQDVAKIAELVAEGKGVLAALVDVSRLKNAVLATHRAVSPESFRQRHPELAREAISRLDFACEILSKRDPKPSETAFATSALESLRFGTEPESKISFLEKVRQSVASVLWRTGSVRT